MQVITQIGRGGFGTVDEVVDPYGQHFARKTFSINQPGNFPQEMADNVKRRFIREANVQSALDHNNIVPVLYRDINADPPYFIMPLALSSLDKEIARSKNLNGCFLEAIMDILAGLEEIHSLGIYHRDLKPQNVLKLGAASGYRYAIGDFGLMSINDTQLSMITYTGMRMGSDFYTAPEIVADLRKASARSDIYSVGCILHDFVGTGDRIPCNEISDDQSSFADIIRICTRRDPSRRFQSVSDLREAILEVDLNNEKPSTQEATDYVNLLDSESSINTSKWSEIISYIEQHFESRDVDVLFLKINMSRANEIIDLDSSLALSLALKYCEWAKSGSFDFSSCDGIANRLVAFFELDDITCKAEVLLALLFLGTNHNRWYVERRFMSLADASMPEELAKRLSLEVRVLGGAACRAFHHLEYSIGANIGTLHPTLARSIDRLCTS